MDEVVESVEITGCVAECCHGPGDAVCPLCGKPCEQDLADWWKCTAVSAPGDAR